MNSVSSAFRPSLVGVGFLLFFAAPRAAAWGPFAHRAIADIAWSELDAGDREKIDEILAAAPEIYGDLRGLDGLRFAATWPDLLREGHTAGHMAEPLSIFSSIGITSSADRRTDNLHFEEIADGRTVHAGDTVSAGIRLSFRALASPAANARERAEALSFLVHCTADAHQPLHCAHAVDAGGNAIELRPSPAYRRATNLHVAWDSGLLSAVWGSKLGPYLASIAGEIREAQDLVGPLDPSLWVRASRLLAENYAYLDASGGILTTGSDLDQAYVTRARRIIDQQVALAGLRTAAVLHKALSTGMR